MKKKLFLLIVCSLSAVCSFSQASGICGDSLSWSFDSSTETLTISGTGAMTDYTSTSSIPWYVYRSQIKAVEIEEGATHIGNSAFYWCIRVTSLTIPNSVESIGNSAFYWCSRLTDLTIPNSVTEIEDHAFTGSGLTTLTIPASVTILGELTFYYCPDLECIEVDEANPSYSSEDGVLFDKEQTILISWPSKKTGSYSIPYGVTTIGNSAFSDCIELNFITIPNSVANIGDFAFYGCTRLSSITIPESVRSIGNSAFANCTSLTSISIPNSVTSISNSLFSDCSRLTTVSIGNSVESIGDWAFSRCIRLDTISLGNNVESIGNWGFYGCTGLVSVSLARNVKRIGWNAFSGCTNLTSITNYNPVPIALDTYVFYAVDQASCILEVPFNSVDLYRQAAVWKDFQIEAIIGTSIPEIPAVYALTIYPNPVVESFRLQGIEENSVVTVLDISGRMVLQQLVNPGEAVDAGNLPKGIYLVHVNGKTERMVKR